MQKLKAMYMRTVYKTELNHDLLGLYLLFLCNYEANEAVVFHFRDEYLNGYSECSLIEISRHLGCYIIQTYNDPKWYQKPVVNILSV